MSPMKNLIASWRERATLYEEDGVADVAQLYRKVADQAEVAMEEERRCTTDLDGAVRYSGYSKSHIRWLVRNKRVENVGRPHVPRFVVATLPIASGHTPPAGWDDRRGSRDHLAHNASDINTSSTSFDPERAATRALRRLM
jgi:hypothetical protein